MLLKKKRKISGGTRHQILVDKTSLSKPIRVKSLLTRLKKYSGRNSTGKITLRHRGGGNLKLYRFINFFNDSYQGVILSTEYDPYRSSFISLVFDKNRKTFFYILNNNEVYPGSLIECNESVECRLGNRAQLKNIPSGSVISVVSRSLKSKGLFSRSGGTCCQLIQKGKIASKIKLPSGKIISLSSSAYATIGSLSNPFHKLEVYGKAGLLRHKGIRPRVRGVAMNPIDHPHGGGEGKTSGGRPSVTPWGRPTKGKPTRKKNVKI